MREDENRGLAKVDAFVADTLCHLAPLRFGVAQTPAELEAVYRLRYEVVVNQGWGSADDFPQGLEWDEFDRRAIHIMGWDGRDLIGTTRLVPPQPGLRLPTEAAFDLNIGLRGRVIDMGRTCRAPLRRDTGHKILWGLLAQAWVELRARGFSEICGIFSPAVARLYRRLGVRVEVLGAPRRYWGEDRQPVLIRPGEMVEPKYG